MLSCAKKLNSITVFCRQLTALIQSINDHSAYLHSMENMEKHILNPTIQRSISCLDKLESFFDGIISKGSA